MPVGTESFVAADPVVHLQSYPSTDDSLKKYVVDFLPLASRPYLEPFSPSCVERSPEQDIATDLSSPHTSAEGSGKASDEALAAIMTSLRARVFSALSVKPSTQGSSTSSSLKLPLGSRLRPRHLCKRPVSWTRQNLVPRQTVTATRGAAPFNVRILKGCCPVLVELFQLAEVPSRSAFSAHLA